MSEEGYVMHRRNLSHLNNLKDLLWNFPNSYWKALSYGNSTIYNMKYINSPKRIYTKDHRDVFDFEPVYDAQFYASRIVYHKGRYILGSGVNCVDPMGLIQPSGMISMLESSNMDFQKRMFVYINPILRLKCNDNWIVSTPNTNRWIYVHSFNDGQYITNFFTSPMYALEVSEHNIYHTSKGKTLTALSIDGTLESTPTEFNSHTLSYSSGKLGLCKKRDSITIMTSDLIEYRTYETEATPIKVYLQQNHLNNFMVSLKKKVEFYDYRLSDPISHYEIKEHSPVGLYMDNTKWIYSDSNAMVHIIDRRMQKQLLEFDPHGRKANLVQMCVDPILDRLATCSHDGIVRVFQFDPMKEYEELQPLTSKQNKCIVQ